MKDIKMFEITKECSLCNRKMPKIRQKLLRKTSSVTSEKDYSSDTPEKNCKRCKEPIIAKSFDGEFLVSSIFTDCSSQPESKTIEDQIPELATSFYGKGRGADLPFDLDETASGALKEFERAILLEHEEAEKAKKPIKTTPKINPKAIKQSVQVDWNEEVNYLLKIAPEVSVVPKANPDHGLGVSTPAEAVSDLNKVSKDLNNQNLLTSLGSLDMQSQLQHLSKDLTSLFYVVNSTLICPVSSHKAAPGLNLL